MKFIIQLLSIMLVAFVFELFLPWWSIAIAAFIGGAVFNTRANFGAGFLAIALLWTLKALIINVSAAAPLTDRVAAIFNLSTPLLFVVTAIIGGLVGGFAAMTGSALNKGKRRGSYY
jgi:phosphotransferase system  glucose/maltose/N-acetylglucosamine-specific IIC component